MLRLPHRLPLLAVRAVQSPASPAVVAEPAAVDPEGRDHLPGESLVLRAPVRASVATALFAAAPGDGMHAVARVLRLFVAELVPFIHMR